MTKVKSWFFANTWTFALQNLPSIYQLGSDFVKQLFRIQIQKGGKVFLSNQLKFRMETCYSELVLIILFIAQWGKTLYEAMWIWSNMCKDFFLTLLERLKC